MTKKEQFNYQRIEWIPPAWAAEEGTQDTVIAFSKMPKESLYIIKRRRPPAYISNRRRPLEYYMEFRDAEGKNVLRKHRLIVEEAYVEWSDADYQPASFDEAFPDNPEIRLMQRENPKKYQLRKNTIPVDKAAANWWAGNRQASSSLFPAGDRLYSFNTVILQKLPDSRVVANVTKYSQTTSKHLFAALKYGLADVFVYNVPVNTPDLTEYVKQKQIIATSEYGKQKINVIRIPYPNFELYYLEILIGGVPKHFNELSAQQAYIEWRDADKRLVGYPEAFKYHIEVANQKRPRYSNPTSFIQNKRRFFYPYNQWHQTGTLLLATSTIRKPSTQRDKDLIKKGVMPPFYGILIVNLFRTKMGYYFIEISKEMGLDPGFPGRIKYLSTNQARKEYRDSDEKKVNYREAFPNG